VKAIDTGQGSRESDLKGSSLRRRMNVGEYRGEVRVPSRNPLNKKEINMEYILDCDYNDNWYVIPDNKHLIFLKWIEDDEDHQVPDDITCIGDVQTLVKFKDYRICR